MIGRALTSGADANPAYITVQGGSCGLAVFSHYLFFANGSVIDATDLDSPNPAAAVQQIFMGTSNACGVAVDSLYQGRLRVLGATQRGDKDLLRLAVSNPGSVLITQATRGTSFVRASRASIGTAGRLSTVVHLTPAGVGALHQRRRLQMRLRVVYTPQGGISTTATPLLAFNAS